MSQLRTLKQRYLTYLGTQWGGSDKMVENYGRYIERFLSFTKVQHPRDITEERVAAFRLYLAKQPGANVNGQVAPMKQRTQNYYFTALRMFVRYLTDQGYETISPLRISLAKLPPPTIDLLSLAELARLRSAPDRQTPVGRRDHAIIELLCSTGIRISELCALSRTDLVIGSSELVIHGTNGSTRTVYVNEITHQAVAAYMKDRKDHSPALFIRYGRKVHDGGDLRIHPRAVQRMIKAYATTVGITTGVTPHMLRHVFADQLLQEGADIKSVQALLGHTSGPAACIYKPVTNPRLPKPNRPQVN